MGWRGKAVILIVLGLLWLWQQWPDNKMHVVFCDVGQGDAAVVVWGSFQAVVDTGPSKKKLFDCLSRVIPFWDRHLDLVFISHPQKDHDGALSDLQKYFRVDKVVSEVRGNDIYRYKDLYFEILNQVEVSDGERVKDEKGENESSMVLEVSLREFSVLFAADIGEKGELALLQRGLLKKTTVLKVPHHGSKYSSSVSFLERLKPVVAVVSAGEGNSYGHPHSDTLIRLETVGAKVLRTDKNGTVEITYGDDRKMGIELWQ